MSKQEIQALTTQLATHENFGQFRFIQYEDDDQIWFVAKDVCKVLGIKNHKDAVSRLDDDEKDEVGITDPIGRVQKTLIVNESGFYSLVFQSRKPAAKKFRKWVTSEVLPSIRKFGYYSLEDGKEHWTGDQWLKYYEDIKRRIPYMSEEEKVALSGDPYIFVWSVNGGKYNIKVCI